YPDVQLVPMPAVDVIVRLQAGKGSSREIGPVLRVAWQLRQLRVRLDDPRRALERSRGHDSDSLRRGPDEGIDLVHHPPLVAAPELLPVREHSLDARSLIVPAEDPAAEGRSDES